MRKTINDNLLLTSSRFIKQKEYWVAKLPGGIGETGLLFAGGTQNGLKKEIKTVDIEMDEHLSGRLKKLSKESDLSLYILLLAGLKLLVYRYGCGGNSDIDNSEIDIISPVYKPNVTGDTFNDFLFIRNRVSGSLTVKELILRVRESVLGAYDNQDFPFEKLLGFLAETRGKTVDTHRSEIECRLKNIHAAGNIEPVNNRLVFSFERENQLVKGTIFYNPGIYEDYYIQQVAGHFITILRNSVEDVNINISEVPLLSKQEKQRLLFDLNNTTAEYPGDKTLHGLFEEQARETPDAVALAGPVTGAAFPHAPGNRGRQIQHLTYRALNDLADRSARTLREKGAAPDVIMAVTVERSIETLINILAILKAGGAYLPIDPGLPPGRIRYMLADSGAEMPAAPGTPAKKGGAARAPRPVIPGNLAYVIYTSGSTGRPKGVLVEHFSAVNLVLTRKHRFEIDQTDRVLQFSSLSFDASVEQVFVALSSGAALILVDEETLLDIVKFDAYIRRQAVTHLDSVPSFLSNIPFKDPGFYSLKRIVSGGEVCPISLAEKLGRYCDFYNAYGPTETTVTAVGMKYRPGNGRLPGLPIGRPIRNTAVYLFDRWKAPVPTAVPGEMYIGGAGVTRGYLNRPELTSETFLPNPPAGRGRLYRTGDLARWLPDDNIEFLGRIDRQVKIRGLRIELGEIENRLLDHETVKETVVLDREEKDGEKYLCAYIVNPEGEQKTLDIPALREYLLQTLPVYMIPTYFVLIDKIPLTPNGKIDRKSLPEPEVKINREYAAPGNETEEKLAAIWSEILGIEKGIISIHSSFFELGGHSLRATILAAKIHKELNVKVPLVEIFKMPTIRELSGYIKGAVKDKHAAMEPVEKKEYYPLSSAQKRLYILHHMETDSIFYNGPMVLLLDGKLDRRKLVAVFGKLIERHESFRTSFELVGCEPFQKIREHVDFEIPYYHSLSETEEEKIIDEFVKPFDMRRPPFFRVGLIKKNEHEHLLMIDMHHIITDGTSAQVIEKEFMALYKGEELPPLRLQYKDYSQWQNKLMESGEIKRQESYWLKQLEGELPVLNLPTDYPRPAVRQSDGAVVFCEVRNDLLERVKHLASETGTTLYIVLLSTYYILLSRLAEQEDIVIGTPISGRTHSDLQNIVGLFVNMLIMRNRPEGEKTFNRFLMEVKENALEAYENQDYQFEMLVDKILFKREPGRHALIDAVILLQNQDELISEDGITIEVKNENSKLRLKTNESKYINAKFDLYIEAVENKNKLMMSLTYAAALFKRATAEKITKYYVEILEQVVENREILLKDIGISMDPLTVEPKILEKIREFGF